MAGWVRSGRLVSLKGSTEPRLFTPPRRVLSESTSLGFEACRFAEDVLGVSLVPWQRFFLEHALELDEDGLFRFRTVILLVSRQNGKTTIFQILALWRLFVDQAELVLGTAQNLDIAKEAWLKTLQLAQDTPELAAEMRKPTMGAGDISMRLTNGARYRIQAASRQGGRGMSADLVFLDELREHYDYDAWAAVTNTRMARPRSQVVCASNAGDYRSVVLRDQRDRAIKAIRSGDTDSLSVGLFEWSAPEHCGVDDRAAWAAANPSLGYGFVTEEAIRAALETTPEPQFRTENLCQWVEVAEVGVFPEGSWERCMDRGSRRADGEQVFAAVDVSWDRARAHVAIASRRSDGLMHLEVVASRAGTEWVVPWLSERVGGSWFDGRVAVQGRGAPASSLIDPLREAGIDVVAWEGPELAKASGRFFDRVTQSQVRHIGDPLLDSAASVAKAKAAGDAWYFDRKGSPADVAPLIAVCAADWLASRQEEAPRISAYEDPGHELMVL